MELLSRKETKQLGTRTVDVDELDSHYEAEEGETIAEAVQTRDEPQSLMAAKFCNGVKELLLELKLVIEFTYNGMKIVYVLREGGLPLTEDVFMKSKFNKHVKGGWRMSVDCAHFM